MHEQAERLATAAIRLHCDSEELRARNHEQYFLRDCLRRTARSLALRAARLLVLRACITDDSSVVQLASDTRLAAVRQALNVSRLEFAGVLFRARTSFSVSNRTEVLWILLTCEGDGPDARGPVCRLYALVSHSKGNRSGEDETTETEDVNTESQRYVVRLSVMFVNNLFGESFTEVSGGLR